MIDHRIDDCGTRTEKLEQPGTPLCKQELHSCDDADLVDLPRQLGNAAFSRKDYVTACLHYDQAIVQEPKNPVSWSTTRRNGIPNVCISLFTAIAQPRACI